MLIIPLCTKEVFDLLDLSPELRKMVEDLVLVLVQEVMDA